MKTSLSKLGEFGLINFITRRLDKDASVIEGIGDDTAIVSYKPNKKLLLTTDMLIEGVHFTKDTPARQIGRKALACSISDICAMGGVPRHALISLGVSGRTKTQFVKDIYSGINHLARKYKVMIVGGDTVKSNKLIINIALTGDAELKNVIRRNGAKPGDQIFVTGKLGGSLKSDRHMTFEPRVKESKYLTKYFKPTAMIDVSDGLAPDLKHILDSSEVGALLYEENIPLHTGVSVANAMYDGEDFELLFTLPKAQANKLMKRKLSMKFYHIGEIVPKAKKFLVVDKDGKHKDISRKGFRHF